MIHNLTNIHAEQSFEEEYKWFQFFSTEIGILRKEAEGLRSGDLLAGKYRIIRELGRGGEGTVYLTKHILTDAVRAVKVSRQNQERRSIHELSMLKRVHHDSLPRIIDVFQEDGVVCLVMEYVEGRALSEYVNPAGVSEQFFFSVAEQLLETLEYLHTDRIPMLHLDVKPSNILIHSNGRLTLLDLGAAMPVKADGNQIQGCFGTPGYAAPEQFDRLGKADERTDLYSFGATMFFLLTGRKYGKRDQKGIKPEGDRRILQTGSFRNLGQSFGWKNRVRKLLLECLEEKQERRPGSAAEVRKKLLRIKRQREFEKSCSQMGIAVLLLVGVLTLAWRETGNLTAGEDNRRQEYDKLIGQAELAGFAQAASLYRQAILLCPGEILPYQKLVDRISADYVFSLEEEQVLQSMLEAAVPLKEESVFEQIERTSDEFGKLAYDLGIAYWYFYEGAGGRAAASGWFAKAVHSANSEEAEDSWVREAEIYARIGSYYEKLGKQDITGEKAADSAVYWEDLSQLCQIKTETVQGEEVEIVRKNLMEERLNLLIFESAELREAGIKKKELRKAVKEIMEEGGKEFFPERCEEAAEAVERAFEEVKND